MERRNITNEFLKECIADALIKLLHEKPIEDITISEITDLAGVGRSTYYRNFASKEDILNFKMSLLTKRWMEDTNFSDSRVSGENMKKVLHFLYSNQDLLMLYHNSNLTHMLFLIIYEAIGPSECDSQTNKFGKSIFSFSVFAIIYEWLKDGMKESPEELAEILFTFAPISS